MQKILKSYGTEGAVAISRSATGDWDGKTEGPVTVIIDGLPVPFFIENAVEKGGKWILKLEDVDTLEEAEELVGHEFTFDDGTEDDEEGSLIGMKVRDEKGRTVGPVTEVLDFPGNLCIEVDCKGTRIVLPLHEDLIIKAGRDTLTLRIPAGLLPEDF